MRRVLRFAASLAVGFWLTFLVLLLEAVLREGEGALRDMVEEFGMKEAWRRSKEQGG